MVSIFKEKDSALNASLNLGFSAIYRNTAIGLLLTALSSFFFQKIIITSFSNDIMIKMAIMGIVPLIVIFVATALIDEVFNIIALLVFYVFCIFIGYLCTTYIHKRFDGIILQILATNFIMFLVMYIMGRFTKIDIISMGSYAIMFVIGFFTAGAVSMFTDGWVALLILIAYVVIFVGFLLIYTKGIANLYQKLSLEQKAKMVVIASSLLYFSFLVVILVALLLLRHLEKRQVKPQ